MKTVTHSNGITSYNIEFSAGIDKFNMMYAWCWRELGPPIDWCGQHIYEDFDPPFGQDRICRINYASFWFDEITDAMAFKIVWI